MTNNIIWAGWTAGSLLGIYAIFQYWLSNKQLGCSLAYGNLSRYLPGSQLFKAGEFASINNWRLWFLLGIPLGSFIAHLSSIDTTFSFNLSMGVMYDKIMPDSIVGKALYLITGGLAMGYGARVAGGCTSGHVIAGCSVINPVSFLAAALFFIGGLVTVQVLFYFIS